MLIQHLLFYQLLSCSLLGQLLKPTYGGGCAIVDKKLYYLGGAQKLPGNVFSRFVYALDLSQGFKTSDSELPWSLKNTDQLAPSFLFPNVLTYGSKILIHGGQYTQHERSMMVYDTITDNWIANSEASNNELVGPYYTNTTDNILVEYFSTWTKVSSTDYLLLGGVVPTISREFYANQLVTHFDPDTNKWTMDKDKAEGFNLKEHSSFLYQGSVYSIGGQYNPSNQFVPMSIGYKYDIKSKTWSQVQLEGDLPSPRVGFNTVFIDGYRLLLLGGAVATAPTNFTQVNDTFILDMKALKYSKLDLAGFLPTYQGCAQKHGNSIIYTLGYSNKLNNLTQIIDLDKLVVTDVLNPTNDPLSTGAIVGIVLACLVVVGVIILVAIWFVRRKNKEQILRPPSPIIEPTWVNDSNNLNNNTTNSNSFTTNTNNTQLNSDPLFSIQSLENTQLANNVKNTAASNYKGSTNNVGNNIAFDDGGMLDSNPNHNFIKQAESKDSINNGSKSNLLKRLSTKLKPK